VIKRADGDAIPPRVPVVVAGGCAQCREAVRGLLGGTPLDVVAEADSHSGALRVGESLRAQLVILCAPACASAHDASESGAAAELSRREWRMLELLASGCSNKKLAQHLSLSMHTVKNELTVLYSKIGVRTRGEAVALIFGAAGSPRAHSGERP